ncbi:MAG: hypothetical protein L0H29_04905, partial [Sinobacteraceae bacterium]|nr:hypothetical protein [Nevskiaceae bacterium]
MKGYFRTAGLATVLAGLILAMVGIMPEPAFADSWLPANVALNGFIRGEMAIKTNNQGNPANLESNPWTTQAVVRPTGTPTSPADFPGVQDMHWTKPVGVPRHVPRFNYHIFRGELTGKWRILPGKLALRGHLVGIVDPGGYSNFNWADANNVKGCVPVSTSGGTIVSMSGCGLQGGDPAL